MKLNERDDVLIKRKLMVCLVFRIGHLLNIFIGARNFLFFVCLLVNDRSSNVQVSIAYREKNTMGTKYFESSNFILSENFGFFIQLVAKSMKT